MSAVFFRFAACVPDIVSVEKLYVLQVWAENDRTLTEDDCLVVLNICDCCLLVFVDISPRWSDSNDWR